MWASFWLTYWRTPHALNSAVGPFTYAMPKRDCWNVLEQSQGPDLVNS